MYKNDFNTIDEYIRLHPSGVQEKLNIIRRTISKIAPDAEESISYRMPTFKLNNKIIVHFAGHQSHIGFYPTPSPIKAFRDQLKNYKPQKDQCSSNWMKNFRWI